MVGSGLSNGAYTIQDVIREMENTREYMDSKTKLTPKDHIVVAFYSFLIFMAFKYAVVESAWGFILVWLNVFFFDTYILNNLYNSPSNVLDLTHMYLSRYIHSLLYIDLL